MKLQKTQLFALARKKANDKKRELEKQRSYYDYNWEDLIRTGNLSKLVVPSLDKYIAHHGLTHLVKSLKDVKVEGIKVHFYGQNVEEGVIKDPENTTSTESGMSLDDSDSDECSDDDVVLSTTRSTPVTTNVLTADRAFGANENDTLFSVNRFGRTTGRVLNIN